MRLTKEVRNNYYEYFINAIDNQEYNNEILATDKDKLQFLFDTFKTEKDYQIKRIGVYNAFMDWAQGLPTLLNLPYSDYDILSFAVEMGSLQDTTRDNENNKVIDNYYNFVTSHYFKLFKKHKIRGEY